MEGALKNDISIILGPSNCSNEPFELTAQPDLNHHHLPSLPPSMSLLPLRLFSPSLPSLLPRHRHLSRSYALLSPSSPSTDLLTNAPYEVFDRNAKRLQKDRAAIKEGGERSRLVDYLRKEVTERVLERFEVSERVISGSEGGREGAREGDEPSSLLRSC